MFALLFTAGLPLRAAPRPVVLGPAQGITGFQAYPLGGGGFARTIAVGDINKDGILDLVGIDGSSVSIALGQGNRTFAAGPAVADVVDSNTLALDDINGDGKLDLLLTGYSVGELRIHTGNGDGTFEAPAIYPTLGHNCLDIQVADLDDDGNKDVVINSIWDGGIRIFYLNAGGVVTSTRDFAGPNLGIIGHFGIGDFDGNQTRDIFLSHFAGSTLGWLTDLQAQSPTLQPVSTSAISSLWNLDVARQPGMTKASVLLMDADSHHAVLVPDVTGGSPTLGMNSHHAAAGVLADLNGDGTLDVIVSAQDSANSDRANNGRIEFRSFDGTTLGTPQVFSDARPQAGCIVAADIDGDDRTDLILANAYYGGATYIKFNETPQSPTFLSATSETFEVGFPGSFQLLARGDPPMVYSVSAGTLPTGVSLNASGWLSGTPQVGTEGAYVVTITADNGLPPAATQQFTLTVIPSRAPLVNFPFLSSVTSYSATMGAQAANDWGFPLTRRGIVYALTAVNPDPKIGGSSVTVVEDAAAHLGGFAETVLGLSPAAGYSFAGFAENSRGISHTSPVHFQTLAAPGSGSLVVTTVMDEDDGDSDPNLGAGTSLREAVAYANALGGMRTVTFSPNLVLGGPATITLTLGELVFDSPAGVLTLDGPGAGMLTVDANHAARILRHNNGSMTVEGMTFYRGSSKAQGGAINSGGALVLRDCVFRENTAVFHGGAVYHSGWCDIYDCSFLSNSVNANGGNSGYGGAVGSENRLLVFNSTFHDNHAHNTVSDGAAGGAIAHAFGGGVVRLVCCTITGNSADNDSGGVLSNGGVDLWNTIVSGNTASTNPDIDPAIANASNSLLGVDPATIFVTGLPADNGGSTPTIALKPGGPAIGGGDNSLAVDASFNPLPTDQRGVARIVHGTVDIGAYEYVVLPTVAGPSVNGISSTGATLGGDVTDDGYGQIARRGVVYARTVDNAAPAIGGAGVTVVEVAGTTGIFSAAASGLQPLTGYSLTAFAENEAGIGYSSVGTFQTTETPGLIVTLVTDTVNAGDGQTSLREALTYANSLGGSQTISFAPGLAGQTVVLDRAWSSVNDYEAGSALYALGVDVTIQGPTGSSGVTLRVSPSVELRHFLVDSTALLTLRNLTLTGGRARIAGYGFGGSVWSFGSLVVRGCTFSGNNALSEGGALQCWGDSPLVLIENSTFSGNSSDGIGGAMVLGSAAITLRHVTITGNSAPGGYAVVLWKNAALLTNTLVAGNPNDGIGSANGGSAGPASANNLIGPGGSAGLVDGANGNFTGVPADKLLLGALADNGGPTPTIAPLAGSPVINAGSVVSGLTSDQRGLVRTVGTAPDIGAVEDSTGDDDPDGEGLTNAQELVLRSNPLAIDSDNDGFNDATEVLSGSDPALDSSVPPTTHVERVLGYGPARGLDLAGNFIYAFNVGTPGAAGQAGDAVFTADNAPGITVTAPREVADWTPREFGNTTADDALETVFRSIRWAEADHSDPERRVLQVDLTGLTSGRPYKLQLLFAESGDHDRRFDVFVQGQLIADDFRPSTGQGIPAWPGRATAIVHEFVAGASTLAILLDGEAVADGGADRNPILNGVTLERIPHPEVETQWVFYNHSEWDGNNAGPDANDDSAIAPDKSVLLPGGIGSYANYTSYSRGLNGIMVDIADLAGTPTAADFTLKTGNNHRPAGWAFAPDPVSVTVRVGAGANNSDRVTLLWNDNNLDATADANEAVAKAWLEVTVLATANTGLAAPYTFYFGNAVGEVGNSATDALVDAIDVYQPYYNQTPGGQAPVTSPYDVNRDRTVDAIDVYLPYYHQTGGPTALVLLNLSGAGRLGAGGGSGPATLQVGRPLSQAGMRQLLSEGRIDGLDPETGLPTGGRSPVVKLHSTDEGHLLAELEAGPGQWRLEWTGDLAGDEWQVVESDWELEATGRGWWLDREGETTARFFRVVEGRSQAQ